MTQLNEHRTPSAWIAVDHALGSDLGLTSYTLHLKGARSLYEAIAAGDWLLVLNSSGGVTRVGRVLRLRSDLEVTKLYFDRMSSIEPHVVVGGTSLSPPSTGSVGRVQWTDFVETLAKLLRKTMADVPTIADQAYIRELLQLAVMDDLLGPAGGPHERRTRLGSHR